MSTVHSAAPIHRTLAAAGFVALALLAAGTLARLHGSSIGIWNSGFPGRTPDDGVVAGTPRFIRIDEWSVVTPAILSQLNRSPSCPLVNPAWGPGRTTMLMNVPIRHWSAVFRPQFWGFFALDAERAFAFYWLMKAILLAGGCFALLLVLTGRPGAAAVGAAWISGSAFVQWWFSSPSALPEMLGSWALMTAGLIGSLTAGRPARSVAAAALAAAAALNFTMSCYPPFQIPLAWLCVVLVAARIPRGTRRWTWLPAAAAVAAGLALSASYFLQASEPLALVHATVYPGARVAAGGDSTLAQAFGGLFDVWMSEGAHPRPYPNVCEASRFVLLFPLPLAALAWDAVRRRPVRPIEMALALYTIALFAWIVFGWPAPLARITGLALVPSARAMLGLGVASVLWCTVCAAGRTGRRAHAPAIAAGVALAAMALAVGIALRPSAPELLSGGRIALVTLAAGGAGYAIWSGRIAVLAACVVAPTLIAHALVNPLARGLAPIAQTRLHREASRLAAAEPGARWAVYGNYLFANYLKAAGATVLNGTRVVPDPELMRVLDPSGDGAAVYNRYGHMALATGETAQARFALTAFDAYAVTISPTSDVWRALGVRYLVLPAPSDSPGFLRMAAPALQFPEVDLWVYRLTDGAAR